MSRELTFLILVMLLGGAARSPAITIDIDYLYDARHTFFDAQQQRDALAAAANFFEQVLTDRLDPIVPHGEKQWIARFTNPATGGQTFIPNLHVPADTLIIMAAGRDLPGKERGQGGPGSAEALGSSDWGDTLAGRGQTNSSGTGATDFGPWGGSITFDTTTSEGTPRDWNFRLDAGPSPGQDDFYSIALHELGHVLGLGVAESWNTWVDTNNHHFTGPASVAQFGGPIELDATISNADFHWSQNSISRVFPHGSSQTPLMVPISGGRREVTELDVAALADIGWEIASPPLPLQSGDADQDYAFDQLDLVQVLQAGKYLSGTAATWGEGDWNGAPGGIPGNPPIGDGVFNQEDIVAALQSGVYLTGPYAAVGLGAVDGTRPPAFGDAELVFVPVPEPSTFALLGLGLLGVLSITTRRSMPEFRLAAG